MRTIHIAVPVGNPGFLQAWMDHSVAWVKKQLA